MPESNKKPPNYPVCPAYHYGQPGCRFCKFIPGGPSDLCARLQKGWQRRQAKKFLAHSESQVKN
jgi:hypothetical protein